MKRIRVRDVEEILGGDMSAAEGVLLTVDWNESKAASKFAQLAGAA